MRKRWEIRRFGVLLVGLLAARLAWGETLEMVTYYPAPAAAGGGFWEAAGDDIYNTNIGNVGIGTMAPLGPLHVVGVDDTASSVLLMPGANTAAADVPDIRVGIGTTMPTSRLTVLGAGTTSATSSLNITNSNGSILLHVRDDGNVGIGNADPQQKLHIAQNNAGTPTAIAVHNANATNGSGAGLLSLRSNSAGAGAVVFKEAACIVGQVLNHGNAAYSGVLMFLTTDEGASYGTSLPASKERMRIAADGSVGIGDASPAALLTVGNGDLFQVDNAGLARLPVGTAAAPALSYTADTNTGLFSAAADTLAFSTNGTEKMRITSAGNVGIGVAAPAQALDVQGTARLRGLAAGAGGDPVQANANGVLSRIVSSRIYKQDIRSLQVNPAEVLRLNPVRFRWKQDGSPDIGLVAEEVDQVLKDLVTYNGKGKPQGVRYDKLSLYLLEVVKDLHQKIEHLELDNKALKQKVEFLERRSVRSGR